MNYLPNKKRGGEGRRRLIFVGVVFLILFVATFLFSALSGAAIRIAKPLFAVGNAIPGFSGAFGWLQSKQALIEENEKLRRDLEVTSEEVLVKNALLNENIELKTALGRSETDESTLVNILARPGRTPYDTIIIDGGLNLGLSAGDVVVDGGSTAIGVIEEVYGTTAKVKLFSAHQTQTEVLLGDDKVAVTLIGHGNNNFTLELPKDVTAEVGDVAILPGIVPRVVAYVGSITKGTDTSLEKALLVSPANLKHLSQLFVVKKGQ